MRTYFIAVLLSLLASVSFAADQCSKAGSKTQVQQCYKQLVVDRKEALEEYYESIMESSNIPPQVKAKIAEDHVSFMKNIYEFCPDNDCVSSAMMGQIKDMRKDTQQYTNPR